MRSLKKWATRAAVAASAAGVLLGPAVPAWAADDVDHGYRQQAVPAGKPGGTVSVAVELTPGDVAVDATLLAAVGVRFTSVNIPSHCTITDETAVRCENVHQLPTDGALRVDAVIPSDAAPGSTVTIGSATAYPRSGDKDTNTGNNAIMLTAKVAISLGISQLSVPEGAAGGTVEIPLAQTPLDTAAAVTVAAPPGVTFTAVNNVGCVVTNPTTVTCERIAQTSAESPLTVTAQLPSDAQPGTTISGGSAEITAVDGQIDSDSGDNTTPLTLKVTGGAAQDTTCDCPPAFQP